MSSPKRGISKRRRSLFRNRRPAIEPLESRIVLAPFGTLDLLTSSDTFDDVAGLIGPQGTSDDDITFIREPTFGNTILVPGAIVRVRADGVLVGQGVVSTDGTWEVTVGPLADGVYSMTAEYEEPDGTLSDPPGTLIVTVDGLAPQRPTLDLINDTGVSALDNVTYTASPVDFAVTAEEGSRVMIKNGETVIDDFIMPGGGPTVRPLALADDGTYLISAEAFDDAGNRSAQSEELVVTIDRMAPADPDAPNMLDASDTGAEGADNVTKLAQPAFDGTAEANSRIRLFANGEEVGQTMVNTNGTWEITSEPLEDGAYTMSLVVEDLAGNINGDQVNTLDIWVDTQAPQRPTLDLPADNDSGMSDLDNVTNAPNDIAFPDDITFTVTVDEQENVTDPPYGPMNVVIKDGNEIIDVFTSNGGAITRVLELAEGTHLLSVEVTDHAGNRSLQSEELVTTVDRTAPDDGGITIDVAASSVVDTLGGVAVTNRAQPAFVGTAEPNSKVRVYAQDSGVPAATVVLVGEGVTTSQGAWEITIEPLVDGQYEITVEVEDLAGNITAATDTEAVIVDPFEPNNSVATATTLGSETEIVLRDVVLHNSDDVDYYVITAHRTGKLEIHVTSAGDIDLSFLDIAGVALAADGGLNDADGVADGHLAVPVIGQEKYIVRVANDIADKNFYDLDIENFGVPVPTDVVLDPNDDGGTMNNDLITAVDDAQLLIKADLQDFADEGITILSASEANAGVTPGAAVEVFVNGVSVGFADPFLSRNTLFEIRLDAFPAPGSDPDIGQWLDEIPISTGRGTPVARAVAPDNAGWLQIVQAAVRIFDGQAAADNRGPLSDELDIQFDPNAPDGTLVTMDLLDASDTGANNQDNVTAKTRPAFEGVAEANTKIRIYANGELVGQGMTGADRSDGADGDGLGRWEITVEPLDDGVYDLTVEVEDMAGNVTIVDPSLDPGTPQGDIEIDSVAPNTPLLDLVEDSDSGRHDDDDITNDNTPSVAMTSVDPNSDQHVFFTDNLIFRIYDRFEESEEFLLYDSSQDAAVDAVSTAGDGFTSLQLILEMLATQFVALNPGGNFAVNASGELLDGVHNLKLEVEDRAGNVSVDFLLDVLVDTQAFAGDIQLDPASDTGVWGFPATMQDGITCDMTPSFFGTAEANNIVTLVIDDVPAGTAVAIPLDGDDAFQPPNAPYDIVEGNWVIESQIALGSGAHTAVVTYEDPAGNRATTNGDSLAFFIDCLGPRITNATLGDISVDGDFTLNENTTSLFQPKPDGGPDPLISSIAIHVSDLPLRTDDFDHPALLEALAEEEGNYRVVGDANGNIPIVEVNASFDTPTNGTDPATAIVELVFHDPGPDGLLFTDDDRGAPLPDDRYTLMVFDTLSDSAGNPLDGESGAAAPFEGNDVPDDTPPIFPTGDGEHGGDFLARFTVDSRPEIGVWSSGSVYLDINGNFTFDPENADYTNRDIVHTLGYATDYIFAGNFVEDPNDTADGFDKLAVYGKAGGSFRWLVDFSNDGVPDERYTVPAGTASVGIPVAGNFDGDADNGDEVGLFSGVDWFLDTDHDFVVDTRIAGASAGLPFVGDFNSDGVEDLGTLDTNDNTFFLDLGPSYGSVDTAFQLNYGSAFIGARERPVATDMDGDGTDDIGLWVPDRSGVTPILKGEWYFIVSHGQPLVGEGGRIPLGDTSVSFTPIPFGHDIHAQFGDQFAVPIVGNFDPPTTLGAGSGGVTDPATPSEESDGSPEAASDSPPTTNATDERTDTKSASGEPDTSTDQLANTSETSQQERTHEDDSGPVNETPQSWQNPTNPMDVNVDGYVTPLDVLIVAMEINDSGSGLLTGSPSDGDGPVFYIDTNGDGLLTPMDALLAINYIDDHLAAAAEGEGPSEETVPVASQRHGATAHGWQIDAAPSASSHGGDGGTIDPRSPQSEPFAGGVLSAVPHAMEKATHRDVLLLAEDFSPAVIAIEEVVGDLAENLV